LVLGGPARQESKVGNRAARCDVLVTIPGSNIVFSALTSVVALRYEAMWFILFWGMPLWFAGAGIFWRKKLPGPKGKNPL